MVSSTKRRALSSGRYLEECYLDAIWFPDAEGQGVEFPGLKAPTKFPVTGKRVVLCEAKLRLTLN